MVVRRIMYMNRPYNFLYNSNLKIRQRSLLNLHPTIEKFQVLKFKFNNQENFRRISLPLSIQT